MIKSKDDVLLRIGELTDQRDSLISHIQTLEDLSSFNLKNGNFNKISCRCSIDIFEKQISDLNPEILELKK